jgi:hypothetical protein
MSKIMLVVGFVCVLIMQGCVHTTVRPAQYCQGDWRCEHWTSRGADLEPGRANWSGTGAVAREYRGQGTAVIVMPRP